MPRFPTLLRPPLRVLLTSLCLIVSCGGGGASSSTTTADTSTAPVTVTTPVTVTVTATVTPVQTLFDARRTALAKALGKPTRLLLGLGSVDVKEVQKQNMLPDIYDTYINGVGAGAWPTWQSPSGAYIQSFAAQADALGAVPMFTLYQMAANGDGNLSGLKDPFFMTQYWDSVRLLFTQLKTYGKPALVNLEPDFWGYTQRLNSDPTQPFAHVASANSADCPTVGNHIAGIASCLLAMARKYAPQAYVGFPPSNFGDLVATEPGYMLLLGAGQADFVVISTLDRDIGCMEAKYAAANCNRIDSASAMTLWDEANVATPNFSQHLALARRFADTLQRPLLWWQTPMGVPATSPGGSPRAWRDNREHYFLTHAAELVAAGGLGVVFSPGDLMQTNITTDGGQYKTLSTAYLAKPAVLP
jgi:hypothetical protein